ncbi:HesA/MoeB/ThiF family protein [Actinomadura sp. 6N118]|uniref:HesA/MoeB/ThiF family protein n=1 Tax=Actinomadura sp. 6N118 TaxID=3375151 RepID=UPI0037B96A3F
MPVALKECVWEPLGDELVVVADPRESITLADPDGHIAALLTELRHAPRTARELAGALAERGITLTEQDVQEGLDGLASLGLLEDAGQATLGDPALDERHSSNLSFFGSFADLERSRAEYVRRLRESHVLVLGVGGGGSQIVPCLAGLGVGAMTLVDHDVVQSRNFSRQFLYRHADLGRSKVERAAEWVREYDPDIEVRTVDRWIAGVEDLRDLTAGIDVMAGGLDGERGSHLWLNATAVKAGIPLVTGGMMRTQLIYCSVDPGKSACLRCHERALPGVGERTTAGVAQRLVRERPFTNALIGPLTMQFGSLVAYEALRYLTGFEPPRAAGAYVVLDLHTGLVPEWQPIERDPACPVCS